MGVRRQSYPRPDRSFMGIGSEGVTAIKLKRKFIGVELKHSYFKHAGRYLQAQEMQKDLFIADLAAAE